MPTDQRDGSFPPAFGPVLRAQDGSFVGTMSTSIDGNVYNYMVGFDASGNIRWSVPNESPVIATADGGVIAQSGVTYANGNATGVMGNQPTYSWLGNAYRVGS